MFYRWTETNIFSVLVYSIWEGLDSFFFLWDLEENMTDGNTFKNWPFLDDFRIENKDGKVLSALCKYFSTVEYNDFM